MYPANIISKSAYQNKVSVGDAPINFLDSVRKMTNCMSNLRTIHSVPNFKRINA